MKVFSDRNLLRIALLLGMLALPACEADSSETSCDGYNDGESRGCYCEEENTLGDGVQTCRDGVWSRCTGCTSLGDSRELSQLECVEYCIAFRKCCTSQQFWANERDWSSDSVCSQECKGFSRWISAALFDCATSAQSCVEFEECCREFDGPFPNDCDTVCDPINACTPDCSGRECGPDPVCGESCGTCGSGKTCSSTGVCVSIGCKEDQFDCGNDKCISQSWICDGDNDCGNGADEKDCGCTPNCAARECGPDPVCGQTCGTCEKYETCDSIGRCALSGIWFDPVSGLTWYTVSSGSMNGGKAGAYCASLSQAGGGWRLPTIGELRSLIRGCAATQSGGSCGVTDSCLSMDACLDSSCGGCALLEGPAWGMYCPNEIELNSWTWSSSLVADREDTVFSVNFAAGVVSSREFGWPDDTICVR